MKRQSSLPRRAAPLLAGLLMGLLGLLLTLRLATAAPPLSPAAQEATPDPAAADLAGEAQACQECHLDVANRWSDSPHAHAFDADAFQERWSGLGTPPECLVCHTTGLDLSTGEFAAAGVQCHACHGEAGQDHPPAAVAIKADTEFCGVCHTTTLSEWRLGGHATAGVGCSDCHDPHSQAARFETPNDLCLNCHAETLGDHADDVHISQGVGCVDCHAMVIPPHETPDDGIVPTGHSFAINAATCVACHTDTLHAGTALPGFEAGAAATPAADSAGEVTQVSTGSESGLTSEQQVQTLQAALASRNMGLLFQGAVVGLVLGGSTAWLVGQNLRRRGEHDDN